MKSAKFSNYTKKNIDKILLSIFFIEWSVSVVKWISNYPPLQLLSFDLLIFSILYHSILIIFIVLSIYLVSLNIPARLFDWNKKKEKPVKEVHTIKDKLGEDSTNFNLLSSVLILILSLLIEFWDFSYYSFYTAIYLAAIFFIITMFIYYLITEPSLKIIMIFIFSLFLMIIVNILIYFIPLWIDLTIWYYTPPFRLITIIILCLIIPVYMIIANFQKKSKNKISKKN